MTTTAETKLPMSRERVLRAAIDFADANGIDSLSMRKLARELGVEAMTLYYYVANKQDLLEGMTDLVAAEIALPAEDLDWKAAVRSRATSAHAALERHPWVSPLWMSVMIGPARMRYMDSALGVYRRAGLTPANTELAFHAVENHVVGYALQEVSFPLEADDLATQAKAFLEQLPTEDYPYLAEHIVQHLTHEEIESGSFEFGLEQLLDGIERLRKEQVKRSPRRATP